MSQFASFRTTGQLIGVNWLYATWVASMGTPTGTYILEETINWPGGGGGKIHRFVNGLMEFDRRAGPVPIVGNTLTGLSSGATAIISAMEKTDAAGLDINPPRFLTSPSQGVVSIGDSVYVDAAGFQNVNFKVVDVLEEDRLLVDISVAGIVNARTWVTRDFTPVKKLPLPAASDARVGNQVAEALSILDTIGVVGAWQNVASDSVDGYQNGYVDSGVSPVMWRLDNGMVEMQGAALNGAPGGLPEEMFTLPVGSRPFQLVRASCANGGTIEISTGGRVDLKIQGSGSGFTTYFFDGLRFRAV